MPRDNAKELIANVANRRANVCAGIRARALCTVQHGGVSGGLLCCVHAKCGLLRLCVLSVSAGAWLESFISSKRANHVSHDPGHTIKCCGRARI